jgi:ketosteroid isomerase-like protein
MNSNSRSHAKAEIHDLIENWAKSVCNLDVEGVVAGHAEDMLMFDVPPPVLACTTERERCNAR